jgi:hypothetical protein
MSKVFLDIKDFFLYLNWNVESPILRTRILAEQSLFTKMIIGIFPTIENSP